jgi:hypothetical protein
LISRISDAAPHGRRRIVAMHAPDDVIAFDGER